MYRICYIILITTCYFLQDTNDDSSDEERIGRMANVGMYLNRTHSSNLEHNSTTSDMFL